MTDASGRDAATLAGAAAAGAWRWIRRRAAVEWIALLGGLALFGYVGWDGALWDARFQLVLHLMAAGAIAGLAIFASRGGLLPRTPIEVPTLGLLAAAALATVSALNVGMSLRAMATMAAYAAVLPLAILAIRHRAAWVGVVTAVPILAHSVQILAELLERRVDWVLVGAPGLPPIRMPAEGTAFGSVAVPPFVIWPAWVLAGLIEWPLGRRLIRTALAAVGIPLTVLSGSRSAWLAIAVVGAGIAVPWLWRRRGRLRLRWPPNARTVVLAFATLAAIVPLALLIGPRVVAMGSVTTRFNLWTDTLNAWLSDPLLGIGPGYMPYARMAAAEDFSFPVRQPHSHNLPLGVLGDSGLVGLAAAAVLVVAVARTVGPWRARTPLGRQAGYLLLGLGVAGLFEDLTFLPNFNVLAILVLAVAVTDAGAVSWVRWPTGARRAMVTAPAVAIAVVLGAAAVTADAGAISYRQASDLVAARRWTDATERLVRSVEIDPWQPTGPKALAVAADAAGETELARRAAEAATRLNPGDAPSWTNLAILCGQLGDTACKAHATDRAVATTERIVPFSTDRAVDLFNAALTYEALERPADADEAYRRSLLTQRLTAFATNWPRSVAIGRMTVPELGPMLAFNRLLAWWEMDEPIQADAIRYPPTRALAHAMRGERAEAEDWLELAMERHAPDALTWEIAVVLHEHWGVPTDEVRRIASVVRGGGFPPASGRSGISGQTYDIGTFRAYPRDGYVRAARRLSVVPPYPWVLERALP